MMARKSERGGRRNGSPAWAAALVLACALGAASTAAEAAPAARDDLEIRAVSTRPEAVSGGDVLVEVRVPRHVPVDQVSVALNGRDVTAAFRPGQTFGALLGLVEGLALGENRIEARSPARVVRGRPTARLDLVNHPITGPVIAGPHQTPFVCETEAWGFGPPLDADCSIETRVEYFYRSATTNTFQPLPAGPLPADLRQTTTSEGQTVPYIVRRERGTINRAVYEIAFLHEPGTPLPTPWARTGAWNGKLVYSFGPGCRAGFHQGRNTGTNLQESQLGDYALSKGYAQASSSLNVFGTTCADLISAESMMMGSRSSPRSSTAS